MSSIMNVSSMTGYAMQVAQIKASSGSKNRSDDVSFSEVVAKEAGTGSSHTVRRAEKDFSIYCTATDGNGKTIVSATENIKIDSGFFARIIAFLKLIFGALDIFN